MVIPKNSKEEDLSANSRSSGIFMKIGNFLRSIAKGIMSALVAVKRTLGFGNQDISKTSMEEFRPSAPSAEDVLELSDEKERLYPRLPVEDEDIAKFSSQGPKVMKEEEFNTPDGVSAAIDNLQRQNFMLFNAINALWQVHYEVLDKVCRLNIAGPPRYSEFPDNPPAYEDVVKADKIEKNAAVSNNPSSDIESGDVSQVDSDAEMLRSQRDAIRRHSR
ncbi:hypothetical protein GUI12_01505 [Anaplasmataceae bacterium AB001_6]|nr:hypothetical protein GUI12_01505 [Anaplasmataceae bacterium AB001_6]